MTFFEISNGVIADFDKNIIVEGDKNSRNLIEKYSCPAKKKENIEYNPYCSTQLKFLLTNECNLSCLYCYNHNYTDCATLDLKKSLRIIDRIIVNATLKREFGFLKDASSDFKIMFHGGGEPSLRIGFIKEVYEYIINKISDSGLIPEFTITTNGVIARESLKWLVDKNFKIFISADGTEIYQNYQRPLKKSNYTNSFIFVNDTLNYLQEKHAYFTIRSTITNRNIENMTTWSKYIINNWNCVSYVRFSPLVENDITKCSNLKSPDFNLFIKNMSDCNELFNKAGIKFDFYETDASLLFGKTFVCPAQRKEQIIVSPHGKLLLCQEHQNITYGEINPNFRYKYLHIHNDYMSDNECLGCSIGSVCRGACWSRRNSISRDYFCDYYKYICKRLILDIVAGKIIDKRIKKVNIFEYENQYTIYRW